MFLDDFEVTVAAERFKLDNDSKDENGRLDADALKNFTIADVSAVLGLGEPRTLFLDDIVALMVP